MEGLNLWKHKALDDNTRDLVLLEYSVESDFLLAGNRVIYGRIL